jgi:RNA polymerase sigma-70 factor, ECF subfamily
MSTADCLVERRREFEREIACFRAYLNPIAFRLTFNMHDAEDLVQETIIRAYQGLGHFAPGTNIRAWMYTILRNTFASSYRKRMREPRQQLTGDVGRLGSGRLLDRVTARSAETEALERLGETEILRALTELPKCFRAAVYLADVQGYRYREIAEMLEIPVGTVMSRLHRARRIMRRRLAAYP